MKKILIILFLIPSFLFLGCEDDFLDTENKEYVSKEQLDKLASSSPESLLAVSDGILTGAYSFMREYNTWEPGNGRHDDFGQKSIDLGLDLMSNDMVQVKSHWFSNYYSYKGRNTIWSTTHIIWNFYYSLIKNMNDIILFIPDDVENEDLENVLGRAKAIRGFAYFQLVRIYQHDYSGNESALGVPIYDGTSFDGQPRATVQEVYTQILSDLESAYSNLSDFSRTSITDINSNVVAGLLARVYLELKDYSKAAAMANEARQGYPLMSNDQWLEGFSNIANPEWIWGADIDGESSTIYASYFSHISNLDPGYAGILAVYKSIDKRLYDLIPDTDIRKTYAGDDDPDLPKYANTKFRDGTFFEADYLYMRSAEMYLIEAEAEANLGNDSKAADLIYELVKDRDPAYAKSTNTGNALLQEIYVQRRIELWGEGFAWFDMKRWGVGLERDYEGTNHVTFGLFNFSSGSNEFVFQIPEDEINANDNINDGEQNPL